MLCFTLYFGEVIDIRLFAVLLRVRREDQQRSHINYVAGATTVVSIA